MRALLPLMAVALLIPTSSALAREWTDATGRVIHTGELVDFDDNMAVIKSTDGRLVAVAVDELSEDDLDYLASPEARDVISKPAREDRTWLLIDGTRISGQMLQYGRGELAIERRNGRTFVSGRPLEELSELQQAIVTQTVAALERRPIHDLRGVLALVTANRGRLSYAVEGVVLQLNDGNELAVPFVLLSEKDRTALKPGWQKWVAAQETERRQQEDSAMLRTIAAQYQRDREFQYRIQTLQFAKDWFDLWEVGLIAPNGAIGSVVVPARSSVQAQYVALRQCPTCALGPTRRISRRTEDVGGFAGVPGITVLR